jgi:diaminohydroxyphosphoribosylaminopyrimidine deaminase / 5-amino-6-(5-phosphoribosylamino)uracil reductase
MAHALGVGQRGVGRTWPNPAVGCIIVQGDRIVGRGWTQPGGRPHAEAMALQQAGQAARGATAYVTLEPCAHHGQTPPCADALIAAGIAHVVTAFTDPDPRVSGQGHTMLRAAGIDVTENVLADAARTANAGFLKRVTRGLPFVTLKLATSLDGRIATSTGESRWITSPASRRAVHALRLTHDAVLIGAGTARADDPDLTARDIGASHQPIRIVMDARLSHSPQSRLGQTARQTPVWICHTAAASQAAIDAWTARGAILILCDAATVAPSAAGILVNSIAHGTKINLTDALQRLAALGLTRILCEGGATLAASLIADHLVDDLITFSAGKLIGATGHPALGPLPETPLKDLPTLTLIETHQIGPDTMSHWRIL